MAPAVSNRHNRTMAVQPSSTDPVRIPAIRGSRRWRIPRVTQARGVAVGVGLAAAALVAKSFINEVTGGDIAYLTLFMVLPVASLIGGLWAGVTVTVAGVIADSLIFQEPVGTLVIRDPDAVARFFLFIPTSLWIAWLIGTIGDLRRSAADEAERFRGLVAALPDFAILTDLSSGRIEYANAAVSDLGWDPDRLLGRDADDVVPGIRSAIRDGHAGENVTLALLTPDGNETMVEVSHRPVSTAAGQQRVLVTARDVSARIASEVRLARLAVAERQSARSLQALLASMDEGVAVIGQDGEVILANDALTSLTGGPVTSRAALAHALGTEISTGETLFPDARRWLRLWVHEGEDAGLVIVRDVTAERESAAAQDAFMGVLSHELRTPVTTIMGLAHLMSRPRRTEGLDAHDLAADIAAEAERLNSLIEDLLVLSRSQGGHVAFDPEPILVQHIAADVIEAEARRYPHVAFQADLQRDLPPIEGDRTFLGQVLRNLVGNAGKYSPATPCEVQVVATRAGDHIEVLVRDQGPGFDADDADRLFDIFFRSGRTARARSGSGIGLYVARTLVEAMHGTIWAGLRDEGGSEFGFRLPVLGDDEPATPVQTAADSPGRTR